MAIAGKPIYAGDPNTLAQLDLQRAIAQDRATQQAISSASRGVQSLLSAKQQKAYEGFKERELTMEEERLNQQEKERQERYTFEEANRAIREGTLDYEQIQEILPNFEDPARRSILEQQGKRLKAVEDQIESEGPGLANRLNQVTSYERQQLQQAREDLQKAEQGWSVFGFGPGSEEAVNEARNRVGMAEGALATKEAAFDEAYPYLQNRYQMDAQGNYVFMRRPGRQAVGGDGAPQPPRTGQPGVSTAPTEPLPPPPPAAGATPMDQKRAAYMGTTDVLPERPMPAPAPTAAPPVPAEEPLPLAPPPEAAPPVDQAEVLMQRSPRGPSRRAVQPPTGAVAGRGASRALFEPVTGPEFRSAAGIGVAGQGPARGATARRAAAEQPAPADVVSLETDPVTGETVGVDASGARVDLTDRLTDEVRADYAARFAELRGQGLPEPEVQRRMSIWLQDVLTRPGVQ